MRQSFLALYTFLDPAHIIFITLPHIIATVYYYFMPVTSPFVFAVLTPYLKAAYTILDFSESYLGIALKI